MHALHGGFQNRGGFRRVPHRANLGFKIAVVASQLQDLAPLHALHQHLDVAVWQLQILDNVGDGSDLVYLMWLRLVDARIMLGG